MVSAQQANEAQTLTFGLLEEITGRPPTNILPARTNRQGGTWFRVYWDDIYVIVPPNGGWHPTIYVHSRMAAAEVLKRVTEERNATE